jgi:hypothetical protein
MMAKRKELPIEYFVCLDTTVVVDVLKEIWEGKDPQDWKEFKTLIDSNAATLLIPQIVLLELEKHVHVWEEGLLKATAVLESSFPDADLSDFLRAWRKKKKLGHWEALNEIKRWLASGRTIEYSIEIAHRAKKRLIAGNYPANRRGNDRPGQEQQPTKGDEWLRDQDCSIIESLIEYFDQKLDGKQLAFATTDRGFGPINQQGIGSLDETFRRSLPATQLFAKLGQLVRFVKNKGIIIPLTKDEEEEIEFEQTVSDLFHRAVERRILSARPAPSALGFDYGQGSQHAASFAEFMRQDYDRRMRNMENYNALPGLFDSSATEGTPATE